MDNLNMLLQGAKELDIELSKATAESFIKYMDLLLDWNERVNLTAITEPSEVVSKHFIDSLTPIATGLIGFDAKVIDVGTGAGFPGLPIKLAREDIKLTLLDSLNKRVNFLNEVVSTLSLKATACLHGRAEDFGVLPQHRESYDIALSRAVAALNVLCEYCLPFVKVGGYFLSMKGPEVLDEVAQAKTAITLLGGSIQDIAKFTLPDTDITHSIVIIKKTKNCPTKYPRKAGKASKDPIK